MVGIKLTNVSYRYPTNSRKSLRKVNLSIDEGEFVAIIGSNSSGKTTLCNVMRGFIPHFYRGDFVGEVTINGKDMLTQSIGDLTGDVGYVFQNPFTQMSGSKETVFEEIGFGLENLGVDRETIIQKVLDVSGLLNIQALLFKNPSELSGGQRQRVSLASIIVMDPKILILDEPTSQLDPKGTKDVFDIIKIMRGQGKTIVLVEHKINEIAEHVDRVVLLNEGKIILDGDTREVLTHPFVNDYGCALPQFTLLGLEMRERGYTIPEVPITFDEAINTIGSVIERV